MSNERAANSGGLRANPPARHRRVGSIAILGALAMLPAAGRCGAPFQTDDPNVLDVGHVELLVLYQGTPTATGRSGSLPGFESHFGKFENAEFGVTIPVAFDTPAGSGTKSGYGDPLLGTIASDPNTLSAADPSKNGESRAATESGAPQPWNLHGQLTFVEQYHPSFTSPYQGANSLTPGRNGEETTDATLFLGVRLWNGAALYVNPEIDQGFGLSDTLGVAGFPSGAAYKVGQSNPYFRLQRAFLRQRFDLGGEIQPIAPGPNELGGTQSADNVTLTVGKFSVTDVFDTNSYAHDPRADFLNWAIIDAASFDYAADAWGYTIGVAVEWTQSSWTLRGGFFDLSDVPNSKALEPGFREFELIGEAERRYEVAGHPGKAKLLGFVNYGRMGSYSDAIALGHASGTTPDTAPVRRYASRGGVAINLEQEVAADLGLFARLSLNQGGEEAYEFTDVNKSISLGLSLKGSRWHRSEDTFGLAAAFNDISGHAKAYFAAGGLGILVGDGQLPHPGAERIFETYYAWQVSEHFAVTADYQYIVNPAYNRDRGPVSVFSLRVHAEF